MVPPKKRFSLANETDSTPQKSNVDTGNQSEDGAAGTPRTTRRRSVIAEEITVSAAPNTPTRRGRRLSEALAEDGNENGAGCATPTRRSRRLSVTLTDDCTNTTVGTPTRRSRRLSGTGLDSTTESTSVAGDPLRRTRRTSGAGLETLVDSPLPLGDTLRRTRRTSGTFADINLDSPHSTSLKRAAPSDIDSKLTTPSKTPAKRGRRKSLTLEEVAEENEEKVSETLDIIKEDEEEKNDIDGKNEKCENDNSVIDGKIDKKESNSEKVNEPTNVTDNDIKAAAVEEKCNTSKDKTILEVSLLNKDQLCIESKENTQAVESKVMEVSETKSEEKSDTNIPSGTNCENILQESITLLKNNTEILNNRNENNNTLMKKVIPRGMPKSGRFWKTEKKRFSTINAVKPLKTTWARKMEMKNQRKNVMEESNAIKEEKRLKKEALRERQRANKELRDKNAKKSEVVQVIKDPRKIKKMKRKQLRYIETRDTSQPAKII